MVDDLHHSSLNWRKLLEWLVVIMVVVGRDNKGEGLKVGSRSRGKIA